MARHFHLETTMRAGCRITTLTSLGGENMLETLRFEHFKSPSTFFPQTVVTSYFSGWAGQVPLPVCFLHRGGAGCGPQCPGPLPGRGPQVLTLAQSSILAHLIYSQGRDNWDHMLDAFRGLRKS